MLAADGACIDADKLICLQCINYDSCMCLVGGRLRLGNVIYDINAESCFNSKSVLSSCLFNGRPKPMLSLKVGLHELPYEFTASIIPMALVPVGTRVNAFDQVLRLQPWQCDSVCQMQLSSLSRLAKLFDNKYNESAMAIVSPVNGVLTLGNAHAGLATYVVIPDDLLIKPVVYDVGMHFIPLGNNSRIKRGGLMIAGDLSCSAYLSCHGFNKFINFFIGEVQRIYESQGVHVNSKHIEILLKQMTATVLILDPGDTEYEIGERTSFAAVMAVNSNGLPVGNRPATFNRCVLGITQLSTCQPSSLSDMAFHGAPSAMLKAMVIADKVRPPLSIKDNLILGRHFKGLACK